MPGKKASRIIALRPGGFRDLDARPELQRWMVETAGTFARVFHTRL